MDAIGYTKTLQVVAGIATALAIAACNLNPIAPEVTAAPSPTPAPEATVIPAPQGCRLAWNDEFDEDGFPNPARWFYDQAPNNWNLGTTALLYQPAQGECPRRRRAA